MDNKIRTKKQKLGLGLGISLGLVAFFVIMFFLVKHYQREETLPNGYRYDSDGDQVPDDIENAIGTDPNDQDSDNDGLSDGTELYDSETDPLNYDSDNDGVNDLDDAFPNDDTQSRL